MRWQAFVVGLHELLSHGDLEDGIFGQGDAHGVTNAVCQQGADAYGALDAAVFAVSRFGDAEVDGIVPVGAELIEMRDEQAVGLDHDLRIAGLHREEEIVIALCAGDAGELEGALDHAERRVAMAVHDAVAQGAVIGADAHGAAQADAVLHQRNELLLHVGHFSGVLIIGVFFDGEFLFVGIVAGVHADFFDPLHGFHGGVRLEVDVGDKRDIAAGGTDAIADVLEVFGDDAGLGGDADDLAAGFGEAQCFFDAGLGVARITGEHALNHHGGAATDLDVSNQNRACFAALVIVEVGAVAEQGGRHGGRLECRIAAATQTGSHGGRQGITSFLHGPR